MVLLLATLTVVTYAPVVTFEFVDWDDPIYISGNRIVQNGLTPEGVVYAFTTFDLGNWIPLTWLSLELDATLFGVNSAAFHAVNVFWHALNVCLAYLVWQRLTGAVAGSVAVAAFFAVHPLHVESVAWVSERKDVLSTFWLLVAIWAYAAYAQQPSRWRMFGVSLAMTLGLLSKPMLVTLPVLLLLLDFWPLRRMAGVATAEGGSSGPRQTWQELLLEKWPLFVIAFLSGLITMLAQQAEAEYAGGRSLPVIYRAGNALVGYGWYLQKTVWPSGLCVFYPHPSFELSWGKVAASAVVLIAISVWVWLGRRQHPHRVTGWLWFLVALLPVIGLLQVGSQAYADRYAYVPHLGLFVLIVWESGRWMTRDRRAWSWTAIGATTALLAACVWMARQQMETWRNTDALWTRALELDPDHPMAHLQLGSRELRAGDLDSAEDRFRRVLFQKPFDYKPVLGLAQIHERRGDTELAAGHYAWVLRLNPKDQFAAFRFSELRPGESPTAEVAKPEPRPEAQSPFRSGMVNYEGGRTRAALERFLEAARIDPRFADAHHNAGLMLKELGRPAEARERFETAIALLPNSPVFHFNLALLYEELGENALARKHYEAVQRLSPGDPESAFRIERLERL